MNHTLAVRVPLLCALLLGGAQLATDASAQAAPRPAGAAPAPAAAASPRAAPAVPAAAEAPDAEEAASAADQADEAAMQARLDAARQRLEQAAQEVASLSLKLGGVERFRMLIDTAPEGGPSPRPRPVLGLQVDPASRRGGATVAAVSPGGAAAQAGVRPGDVITSLGGRDLSQDDEAGRALVQAMRDVPAGKPLKLRVLRAGKPLDLTVTPRLAAMLPMPPMPPLPPAAPARGAAPARPAMPARPADPAMAMLPPGGEPMLMHLEQMLGGVGGMELANLSPQLGRYFGATEGVLVVHAPADAAWKIEDGDVITAIDGRAPNSGAHATRILASYQPGEKVNLKVLRQRKPLVLEIVMPAGRELPAIRQLRIERRS